MSAFRSLYRRVIDHYRREGLRATSARVGREVYRRVVEVLPVVVASRVPGAVFGYVDAPLSRAIEAGASLNVVGWGWSTRGIQDVRVYVDDDLILTTTAGVPRPDVAANLGGNSEATIRGFDVMVPVVAVHDGDHELRVDIRDAGGALRSIKRRFRRVSPPVLYHAFFESSLPDDARLDALRTKAARRGWPAFRLWIDGSIAGDLGATLDSIASQGYPIVTTSVVLPDEGELSDDLALALTDRHVAVDLIPAHGLAGAVENSDKALHAFLLPGEVLSTAALLRLAVADDDSSVLLYSDHDYVYASGRHVDPQFTPSWSPDRLLCQNYIGGLFFTRGSGQLAESLRALPRHRDTSWRFRLLLDLTSADANVQRVPELLWSSPITHETFLREGEEAADAVRGLIAERGWDADVVLDAQHAVRRIEWTQKNPPKASIIIPTTGRLDLIQPCLDSLFGKTVYPAFEVIVVDNSRGLNPDGIAYATAAGATVLVRDEPFNYAKLCNDGARVATGDLLVFLNDDVEVTDARWLTELAAHATREGIGTAGPLLLYPDGTIQHAGVVLVNHGGGAAHLFRGLDPGSDIYFNMQRVAREVSANTGACLVVTRDRFASAGGFDESLPVIGNDIDLCLRIADAGYRNIWTPNCSLVHRESVTRGSMPVVEEELHLRARWTDRLAAGDPYYNPSFSETRFDCAVDWSRVKAHSPEPKEDGVNLVGYVRAEMGLGEAVRGNAFALSAAHLPFVMVDYSHGNPARMRDESWLHKIDADPVHPVNIIHINGGDLRQAVERLPAELLRGRFTISYWTWELPDLPDDWVPALTLVDEIWAPSAFVADAVRAKSDGVPVEVMPYCVPERHGPFLDRSAFGLDPSAFTFLAMYDVHSVPARKNPDGAVEAFTRAFAPDDASVQLVLKVNGGGPDDKRKLQERVAGRPNVRIVDRTLDRFETDSVIATSDCYISLHRSEGFGLPLAEAMQYGKPVVATGWSGNVDFMDETNSAPVRYQLVKLDRAYGPYEAGQTWAEPDIDHAAWWLRRISSEPNLARDLGAHGRMTVRTQLSPQAVGRRMTARLAEIRR